jgi:hypothetical protein
MAGLRQHWPRILYRTLRNHANGPTRTTKPDIPTQHYYPTPETWCYSLPSKTKRWPDTRWIMSHHITEHGLQSPNTGSSPPSTPSTGWSSSKKSVLLRSKEQNSGSRLHSTWSNRTLWDNAYPFMCSYSGNAFDRISPHQYLFQVVRSYGISQWFFERIKSFFEYITASVQINRTMAGPFTNPSAVRQICSLSMALHALWLQLLLRMLGDSQ